jgi:hypothetical protein
LEWNELADVLDQALEADSLPLQRLAAAVEQGLDAVHLGLAGLDVALLDLELMGVAATMSRYSMPQVQEKQPTQGGKLMTEHRIGTQEEWQAERDELLKEEKELTRRGDELARKRRELPWVPVEKDYRFET